MDRQLKVLTYIYQIRKGYELQIYIYVNIFKKDYHKEVEKKNLLVYFQYLDNVLPKLHEF